MEVLSSSEIEQLLKAISDYSEERPTPKERKVRIYDFKRPDKLRTKDVRNIAVVMDSFAKSFAERFNETRRFNDNISVHLCSVEQITLEGFYRSLPSPNVLETAKIYDKLAILEIDPNLILKAVGHDNEPNYFLTEEERKGIEEDIMIPMFELLAEEFTNADAFFNENKNNISLESIKQLKFHNNDFTPSWSNGNMCCNCTFEVRIGKKRSYEETLKDVKDNKEPEVVEGFINITFIAELAKELSDKMEGIEKEENKKEKIDENILKDTKVPVEVFLGSTKIPLKDILSYKPGSIIELDTLAGEAVEIRANGATVAHGEVVVLEEKYGVRIIDMV